MGLQRVLSPEELENWHCLATISPTLSESADSVIRPHTASSCFIVKSLYSRLIEGSAIIVKSLDLACFLWHAHVSQ